MWIFVALLLIVALFSSIKLWWICEKEINSLNNIKNNIKNKVTQIRETVKNSTNQDFKNLKQTYGKFVDWDLLRQAQWGIAILTAFTLFFQSLQLWMKKEDEIRDSNKEDCLQKKIDSWFGRNGRKALLTVLSLVFLFVGYLSLIMFFHHYILVGFYEEILNEVYLKLGIMSKSVPFYFPFVKDNWVNILKWITWMSIVAINLFTLGVYYRFRDECENLYLVMWSGLIVISVFALIPIFSIA